MDLLQPWTDPVILSYVELFSQNNLSAVTVQNHISVLSHYFQLYWPLHGLQSRQLLLFVKSLKYNDLVKRKIRDVLNIDMLQALVHLTLQGSYASTLVPLYLLAFFFFFF